MACHFSGQRPRLLDSFSAPGPPFCELLAYGPCSKSGLLPGVQGDCSWWHFVWALSHLAVGSPTAYLQLVHLQNPISSSSHHLLTSSDRFPCPSRPRTCGGTESVAKGQPTDSGHELMPPVYWSSAGKLAPPQGRAGCGFPLGDKLHEVLGESSSGLCGHCA